MKKEEIQKIVLLLIIAFGICYSYYSYLFLPEWGVIQTNTTQLNERQDYYQRLVVYAANASDIEKETKLLEAEQKMLLSETSAKLDKPEIIVYLYNLLKQYEIVPDKVVFGQSLNKGTYQELPLTLTFSGNIDVVLRLINNLQYLGTQRFAIQSTKFTNQQGKILVELKLVTYSAILPGIEAPETKPPYMIYPFGTATPAQIFNE